MRARHVFGVVAIFSIAGIVVACTHDFDAFEASSDQGSTTTPTNQPDANTPVVDGGTIGSIGDGASANDSSKPADSAVPDAPSGCQQTAASCVSQRTICLNGCGSAYTQCMGPCPNGNPGKTCRDNCKNQQTLCVNNCVATCQTCAGASCTGVCN